MARPSKNEDEKVVSVPASVLPSVRKQIQEFARPRRWSASQAAGYLIQLGLEVERNRGDQLYEQAQAIAA